MKYSVFLILLFAVCLACLMPASANAQDQLRRLSVEQVSSSRVVVFPDHPDKAGIFISTSIPRLDVDSNLGIVEDRSTPGTGEYQIIIEPFRQIIYITAPGFQRASFQTGNLNPRDVIFLEIEPEADVDNLISVVFNVSPATAELYVDGQQFPVNETIRIAPGNRDIRLESEGYRPIEDFLNVDERNILFTYQLEEIDLVPVQIRSNAGGARVVIDGTERGQIDQAGGLGLFLFPGTYVLNLSMTGYVSQNRTVEVSEAGPNEFQFNLERNVGELDLRVSPSDARVLVNRQDFTGQPLLELAPGRYRLEIERDNYESYSETIDIELNQRISRQISLEAHTGSLQFTVTPSNARVRMVDENGEVVNEWSGIQMLRNIQAGTYALQVEADGHDSKEERIQILRDQTVSVRVELLASRALSENELSGVSRQRDTQTAVVDVTNPATGRIWMDRNLGASRAATSSTDSQAYGDLYQWGRGADGHQLRNSSTTSTLSSTDQPGHGDFILAPDNPIDWRSPQNNNIWQGVDGVNNPCPTGYRLPTETEWMMEYASWSSDTVEGAFDSPLKLPLAGGRSGRAGLLFSVDSSGFYWSGSVSGSSAGFLRFDSFFGTVGSDNRALGFSVRCIKD